MHMLQSSADLRQIISGGGLCLGHLQRPDHVPRQGAHQLLGCHAHRFPILILPGRLHREASKCETIRAPVTWGS